MAYQKTRTAKDVRKKLKEIEKKTRANKRRRIVNDNKGENNNKNNDNNAQNHPSYNQNPNAWQKSYNNFDATDGIPRDALTKQYHGVWRCRKGGIRYYVGLDGKEYENKEARQKCIEDKNTLEKLAETKRQLQSPSYLLYLQQQQLKLQQQALLNNNNNNNGNDGREKLNYWQIPQEIVENYASSGIKSLYKWQIECLSLVCHNFDNLIYSAPTSGGKTLICEILMIRQILLKRKKCLFILPFISLVCEKVNDLKSKLSSFGIIVEGYHSSKSIVSIEDADIICCTIEKANSIINKLIEEDTLIQFLGCCVIDEFHYIGDRHRGWILEIMIAKLLYISSQTKSNIQLIGMSATLPNLKDIAEWTNNAKLYITKNRPVTLTQFYKFKDILYDANDKTVRSLQQIHMNDTDHVFTLCLEIVNEHGSVLVFCEKKNWCKTCCKMLSDCYSSSGNQIDSSLLTKRKLIIEQLRELPQPICDTLEISILNGIGYHHAGLTLEEREIIESGFRQNVINILVATSTLAAGVNLPARRVIFRTIKIGKNFIKPSKYKQMSGRAGRKGIDLYGESIIICKDHQQVNYVKSDLINHKLLPIKSQIINNNHIQRLILEGLILIKTLDELDKYLKLSLKYKQLVTNKDEFDKQCKNAMNWLFKNEFVILNKEEKKSNNNEEKEKSNGEELEITSLGYATIGSGLDPIQSLIVFNEIEKTRKNGIHFTNSLHLCYLLSPVRNNGGNIEPNWEKYYDLFLAMSTQKREIAQTIGISESVLTDWAHNISNRPRIDNIENMNDKERLYLKYKRFYCAIVLNKIIEEKPLYEIEKQFGIDGGKMQLLQTSSASFASSLSIFCLKLNWNCMAQIIAHFSQRLNFGVCSELLPLMKISNIKSFRARILYESGIKCIDDIINCSLETIVLALSSQLKFDQNNSLQKQLIINNAQKIKYEANRIFEQQEEQDEVDM